ncbi:MAG: hypothetical protein Q7P63_12185 [Verrucomicrobiota bacterium JB022]|nr:hypothetical protein [Verrucomicrobiota bacterium JB022]
MGIFRNNDWWLERKRDYQQDPAPYQIGGFVVGMGIVVVVAYFVISSLQPDYSESFDTTGEDYQLGPRNAQLADEDLNPLSAAQSVVERRRQMQTLVERVYQAAGGKVALEEMRSIRKNGTLEQGDEVLEVSYQYKRPQMLRFTVSLPDGSLRMGYNGQEAWQQYVIRGRNLPPQPLPENEAHMIAGNVELVTPLTAYFDSWDDLSWQESATVGDREAYVVRYLGSHHPRQTFYIDKQTYYVLRREREHINAQGKAQEVAVVLGNYQQVNGLYLPLEETVLIDGVQANRFEIESIEPNVGLPDSFFSPNPADIDVREALEGQ